jgi:hypothetical protein
VAAGNLGDLVGRTPFCYWFFYLAGLGYIKRRSASAAARRFVFPRFLSLIVLSLTCIPLTLDRVVWLRLPLKWIARERLGEQTRSSTRQRPADREKQRPANALRRSPRSGPRRPGRPTTRSATTAASARAVPRHGTVCNLNLLPHPHHVSRKRFQHSTVAQSRGPTGRGAVRNEGRRGRRTAQTATGFRTVQSRAAPWRASSEQRVAPRAAPALGRQRCGAPRVWRRRRRDRGGWPAAPPQPAPRTRPQSQNSTEWAQSDPAPDRPAAATFRTRGGTL